MILRDYQQEMVEKIINSTGNVVAVACTGAGKSIVIAELANRLGSCLILQPSKEIIEQNVNKLSNFVDSKEIGIYCAGLNRKDIAKYTFATIQSIYKKGELFKDFNLVIIDECHDVITEDKKGGSMYNQLINSMGKPRILGLTATPYRTVCETKKVTGGLEMTQVFQMIDRGEFWDKIIYAVNPRDLIEKGYLVDFTYHHKHVIKANKLKGTDYDLQKITYKEIEILKAIEYCNFAKSILVFCPSVELALSLAAQTPNSACIHATSKDREELIKQFKEGTLRVLFNVGTLTTGFDFPELDCIILARPTKSISLYIQMLGRGARIAKGKTTCHIVDLTNTTKELGGFKDIRVVNTQNGSNLHANGKYWQGVRLSSYTMDFPWMKKAKQTIF
jgi:DNA repair protein RadD